MLPEDVEMVRGGVQWRDAELGALLAPVAVVVVTADVGDMFAPAEDADHAAGERGLPGGGVSDHAEHDRTSHSGRMADERPAAAIRVSGGCGRLCQRRRLRRWRRCFHSRPLAVLALLDQLDL